MPSSGTRIARETDLQVYILGSDSESGEARRFRHGKPAVPGSCISSTPAGKLEGGVIGYGVTFSSWGPPDHLRKGDVAGELAARKLSSVCNACFARRLECCEVVPAALLALSTAIRDGL